MRDTKKKFFFYASHKKIILIKNTRCKICLDTTNTQPSALQFPKGRLQSDEFVQ
jgi:hypothetical protein